MWRRGEDPDERIEREVDDEIRLHLERRVSDLRERGYDPDAAWHEAIRRFGDIERTRTVCIEADRRWEAKMRWRTRLDQAWQDLSTAWRSLRKRPGFAASAVLTLALGIGIATVIFSAADHVLFRPLPYSEAERAVTLWVEDPSTGESRIPIQPGDFLEWRQRAGVFETLALAEPYALDMVLDDRTVSLPTWLVTPGFFEALGLHPRLGRGIREADADSGATPVVIVSDGFWKRRLGGDPAAVGSTITLDGVSATVVGVLPEVSHLWPKGYDLWAPKPFRSFEREQYGRGYMYAVGRLQPGVTTRQAQHEMDRVDREVDRVRSVSADLGINVVPLERHILGEVRPAFVMLLGAVGLLLLVACANVAGLLLARGAQRSRDLAVRSALGASRRRLFRHLFTESVLLAALGGVLGLAASTGGVALLRRFVPPELPRSGDITLDARALAFAAAVTLGTAVLCGLLPALRFSRPEATLVTGSGPGRGGTEGPGRNRLRQGLVILEVATAMVLLVGGGLLGKSYGRLLSTDPGFEWEGVAAAQAFLWDRNPTARERYDTATRMLEEIRALPGVTSAGISTAPPFLPDRIDATNDAVVEGRPPDEALVIYTTIADSAYFPTLSIPVVRGRSFRSFDDSSGERVTLLNETAARLLFPGEDPLGRRVTFGAMGAPRTWRVVGVVGDVRPESFDSPTQPEAFVPFAQNGSGSLTFVAKGTDSAALHSAMTRRIWQVDPGQSVYWSGTMESVVSGITAERRFQLVLLGTFGVLSLVLAAVGLFGLISFSAQQRTREVGIRIALGARRGEIVGLVLRDGVILALLGVGIGALGAAALSRTISGLLYGVAPTDPITYLVLGGVMVAVAALASFIPARRAANKDPVRALRSE